MSEKYNVIFYGTDFFARACLEQIHKHPNVEVVGAVVAEKARKCEVKAYCKNHKIPAMNWKLHKAWLEKNYPQDATNLSTTPGLAPIAPDSDSTSFGQSPEPDSATFTNVPTNLNPNLAATTPKTLKTINPTKTDANTSNLPKKNPDFAVVASFGHFIPGSVLKKFKYGGINVHGSLLPAYRGSTPLQRAILEHEKYTGITLQLIDKNKLDVGDVLLQSDKIFLNQETTVDQLYSKAAHKGGVLLEQFFDDPETAFLKKWKQPKFCTTKFAKLFKKEENWDVVDFETMDAMDIYARFRVFKELKLKFYTDLPMIPETQADIHDESFVHETYKNVRVEEIRLIPTPVEFSGIRKGALFSKHMNPKKKNMKAIVICDDQWSIELEKLRIVRQDNTSISCNSGMLIMRNLIPFSQEGVRRNSRYFSKGHFEHMDMDDDDEITEYRASHIDKDVNGYYFV
jgi:methionyl-tRNA formyltransferase